MRRNFARMLLLACLVPMTGCADWLGWYRAAGHIPGIAPTDYAFYNFCGVSSQIFQFSPVQIESSTPVALADLGFKTCVPPIHREDGVTEIHVKTPDGRPTKILISARGNNTEMKVEIGPGHLGDEELSRDLFRRVALNFGAGIRAFTPIDPTLPVRINPIHAPTAQVVDHEPPATLKGEGLRPNQNRDQPDTDMQNGNVPTDGSNMNVPGYLQFPGLNPSSYNPNMPYVPFPFTPTYPDNDQQ